MNGLANTYLYFRHRMGTSIWEGHLQLKFYKLMDVLILFKLSVIREDSTTAPFEFRVEETTSSEEAEIENTTTDQGGLDDLIEILGTSESKTDVESKLLSMITNDPGEAADALSSLFEHDNQGDHLNTKKELMDLMVRDPVAVTAVS